MIGFIEIPIDRKSTGGWAIGFIASISCTYC